MQKISPFLWFDNQAEEAVNFYMSVFPDVKIGNVSRYMEGSPGPVGQVMVMEFELFGQNFMALNGGPIFQFSPAISFMVHCETQDEVDTYWDKLAADGREVECGWVTDKFGVTWQIVPNILGKLFSDPDREKAGRAMQAMLKMKKLIIADLQAAFDGE